MWSLLFWTLGVFLIVIAVDSCIQGLSAMGISYDKIKKMFDEK